MFRLNGTVRKLWILVNSGLKKWSYETHHYIFSVWPTSSYRARPPWASCPMTWCSGNASCDKSQFGGANCDSTSMWRLWRNPPIGSCLFEIREAGPCRGAASRLRGGVRWGLIWTWKSWRPPRLPGQWPDGGRSSTVVGWTRRRAAPAYASMTWPDYIFRYIEIYRAWNWYIRLLQSYTCEISSI